MDNRSTPRPSYYKYLTSLDKEDPAAYMMFGTVYMTLKARRGRRRVGRRTSCSTTGPRPHRVAADLLQYAFVKTIETLDQLGDRATASPGWPSATTSWVATASTSGEAFLGL